jgi:hypothetical protein
MGCVDARARALAVRHRDDLGWPALAGLVRRSPVCLVRTKVRSHEWSTNVIGVTFRRSSAVSGGATVNCSEDRVRCAFGVVSFGDLFEEDAEFLFELV